MKKDKEFFYGIKSSIKIGIIWASVFVLLVNVYAQSEAQGTSDQSAEDQVANMVAKIEEEMNAVAMELNLTRQAYEHLSREYEESKIKRNLFAEQLKLKEQIIGKKNEELAFLKQKMHDFDKSLKEAREKIDNLQEKGDKVETLKYKIIDYEKKIAEKEKKLGVMQLDFQKKELSYRQQMQKDIEELWKKLGESEKASKQLNSLKQQLVEEKEKYAGLISDKDKQLDQMQKKISLIEKQLQKKEEYYVQKFGVEEKALREELTSVEKQAEQLKTQNEEAHQEKENLASQVKEHKKQLKAKDKQLDKELLGERERYDSQAKINRQILATLNEEKDYLTYELETVNDSLKKARQEINPLKAAKTQVELENKEFKELIKNYTKQLVDKEKEVESVQNRIQRNEKEYHAKLKKNKKEVERQIKTNKRFADELEKKTAAFMEEKERYLSEIENVKDRLHILKNKHNLVKSDRDVLAKKVKQLYKNERKWKNKDKGQLKLLSAHSEHIDELKEELDELKTENKRLSFFIKTMPEKITKLEGEVSQLRWQNATLHYNLGVFHTQRQEYTQAIAEFEQALKFNTEDPSTHYNLGIIYSQHIIDKPKAIIHFKHYLALAPRDKDSQRAKEYILIWGKQGYGR